MAPLSCGFSFIVVRRIGGQALEKVQWKLVKRACFISGQVKDAGGD